jgi:hypothetical protein
VGWGIEVTAAVGQGKNPVRDGNGKALNKLGDVSENGTRRRRVEEVCLE